MRIGITSLIRKFKSDDFTTRLDIENDLKSSIEEYGEMEKEQETAKGKEEDLQNQIVRLNEKIVKLNADSGVSIEELEKRLKILQKKKDKVNTDKDSIQNRITQREELQITLEEILDKFDEEDLEEGIGILLNEAIKGLFLIKRSSRKVNIKLESLYERKEHLDSHKYNEDCDICMENSKSILETKEKVEKK